jgi:DNA-binding NarL/FixJ family response regulator
VRPPTMVGVSAPRVVVVDDHPGFRRVARELLRLRGYAVLGEADCAASALDLVTRVAPDAVLLDVRLGDESGLDVARTLTGARPDLAVLLVSTDEELEGLDCVGECGARGFVAKRRLADVDLGALLPVPGGRCDAAG